MRTEKEILADIKKLGCTIRCGKKCIFIRTKNSSKYWLDVEIDKEMKFIFVTSAGMDFVFIPLLNELFELWGWLEYERL